MKNKLLLTVLLACSQLLLFAQGITTPRTASPAASLTQTIGISTVTVTYSRPSVKGRDVWGVLVPYGYNSIGNGIDAPWRAGANENTTIEFSHNAKVEGKAVPAGKYGFFLVINKDNTGEVVLSKDNKSWGHFFYNPANDLLRAPIKIRDNAPTEVLTYDIINLNKTSGELVLNWEKKQFPVKIEFDVDNIVMANASDELKGVLGFGWQGPTSAAAYASANNVNIDQAVKWIDQAIAINKSFGTMQVKAGLLRQTNQAAEADKLMKEAIVIATEVELNAYGYQLMAQGQNDKAIEMLALNTERHPTSANAWDSLGEAYAIKGDNKNAVRNFKKSLSLNPTAAIRANSEKYLRQMGAM